MQRPRIEDFDKALGRVIRQRREAAGLKQEDVALKGRQFGLDWVAATVAGIETGRRQLHPVELLLLPNLLAGGEKPVDFVSLVREVGWARWRNVQTSGALLAAYAGGTSPKELFRRSLAAPESEGKRRSRSLLPSDTRWRRLFGKLDVETIVNGQLEAGGEAERKAAYKFGVKPIDIAITARATWGCSLTAKRDAELDARADADTDPARVRALRGRITRDLLAELAPTLDRLRAEIEKQEKEN